MKMNLVRKARWASAILALAFTVLCLAGLEPLPAAETVSAQAGDAQPKSGDLPWEKGSVSVGGFLTAFDSTLAFGVDTVFNFDLIRGTYSYAVLQDDRMRIALGLGVYAVPLRYRLHHLPALSGTGPCGPAA